MKRSLITLAMVAMLTTLLLAGMEKLVNEGISRSQDDLFSVWNDIYDGRASCEILINGSSRAVNHISPRIMDSILGVTTYNIGMSGFSFNMHYNRFKIFMKHNKKPKYIIHNIDQSCYHRDSDLNFYQQFIPYLSDPIIRSITDEYNGKFSIPEKYFPYFKYNGKYDLIRESIKSQKLPHKISVNRGYVALDQTWDTTHWAMVNHAYQTTGIIGPIDTLLVKQWEEYITYCKNNGIKLIFEQGPIYYKGKEMYTNRKQVLDRIQLLADKNNIPILDFSDDSLSYDSTYFANFIHLNKAGSEIFCTKLAVAVKKLLDSGY